MTAPTIDDPDRSAAERFFAFAATPRGAITIWCLYVAATALIRYSLSHTLSTDDVVESLRTQEFRLGYTVRNPPLWNWLLWTIQQVVGPGFLSHLILRYGCLALLGIAAFRASYAASGSARWSAAVTLTLPLFHQIGWPLFEWGTNTLLLLVICLFSIELAFRFLRAPRAATAAGIGFLVGLGLLSKYGYAFFLFALLTAMIAGRGTRAALFRRELLLVPVVALLTVSPFVSWLVTNDADLVSTAGDTFQVTEAASPWLERSLYGLRKLVENSAKFFFPWTLVAGIVVWLDRRAGGRPSAGAGTGERVLGLTLLVSAVLATVGVVIIGPANFTGGYIVPVVVTAVPYGACVLSRLCGDPRSPFGLAAVGVVTLVVIALIRLAYLSNSGFPENSYRRDMWPIDGLAAQMRAAGFDRGTLATINWREAGNLRAALPDIRAVRPSQPEGRPSIRGDQGSACRLLWNDTEALFPGERWARTGDRKQAEALPGIAGRPERHFDVPWSYSWLGNQRTSRWTVIELAPDDPICR